MTRLPRFRNQAVRWRLIFPILALATALAVQGQDRPSPIAAAHAPALEAIRADSLRGHLSFLASDLLEGRGTPSRGLDIAAEYIASRFRAAGLEPVGDSGYFQEAHWKMLESDPESFRFTISLGDQRFRVPARRVSLNANGDIDLQRVGLFKLAATDMETLEDLDPKPFRDKAIVFDPPRSVPETDQERAEATRSEGRWRAALLRLKPALLIVLDRSTTEGSGLGRGVLIDPERPSFPPVGLIGNVPASPAIQVHDPELIAALEACPAGPVEGSASLELGKPAPRPVVLKNVVGLLRGSDPVLKDEYVIVSAHYDHLGIGEPAAGDRIYNGANDDASGTAMVIELAEALTNLETPPSRSLLFLTFFGEEGGLLGSRYYGRHPVVPLERTIAQVNLEQVGRTDDSEGPQVRRASLTGFDFSEVGAILRDSGRSTGVKVFKHPRNSNAFFSRSDNQALADLGIPAHTLCVAYLFPDYHGLADHWEKIDFENMERVARTVALGLLRIADRPEPPRWNADEPLADRYRKAWQALHEDR